MSESAVPVVDIGPFLSGDAAGKEAVARAVDRACRCIGFLIVGGHGVPRPVPGTFIVNLGDLMAQWTNGRWVSTLHRVVNPPTDRRSGSRRASIAFFHQPNHDARIECLPTCRRAGEPPRHAPTTSGAHLLAKTAKETGTARDW